MTHARARARSRSALVALSLAATVAGPVVVLQAAPAGAAVSAQYKAYRAELREDVVRLTNAARKEAGCKPLKVSLRLTKAAQLHANDMNRRNYFSHTSRDGRQWWERITATGWDSPGAENIAYGQPTPTRVVRAWMKSPGHRKNIENCKLDWIGVGYTDRFWVQDFGY
jgi:uncharacterized protein YkwD